MKCKLSVKTMILAIAIASITPPASGNQSFSMGTLKEGTLLNDINLLDQSYEMDEHALIGKDPVTRALGTIHEQCSKAGLSFYIEQAFNQSWIHNAVPDTHSDQTWYLLHAHAAYNLIESNSHQGTWIKVELSGSSALNHNMKKTGSLDSAFGSSGPSHTDIFEDGLYYLPEILVSQGLLKGKAVIMAGMINQTNYFDANSYANSSFGQFTNAAFVNNQVLPLSDSNFGVILQGQFNPSWYGQLGANMTDNQPGHSPFNNTRGRNFNIIGELGWIKDDVMGMGEGAYRIQPFMFRNEGENSQGGIAINMEQDLGKASPLAIYSRAGWSKSERGNIGGASFQASTGLIFKKPLETLAIMKEADNNFFGVGFAITKPDKDAMDEGKSGSKRELTFECTYNFAITRFLSIQPIFQYIHNPANRGDTNHVSIFAVQSVLYF